MTRTTRRRFLQQLSAAPAAGLVLGMPRIAHAAPEISLKYGNNLPLSHPMNVRAAEAAERVARESKGRLEVKIFPNNQLGGDTDMLGQVRNGGIDMFTAGTLVIATVAPISAITGVGFAFNDYAQVWKAVDGPLGNQIRAAFAKIGLHTFEKMWDNGFRQITTSNRPIAAAADLNGLKIRVPVSPMGIAMFKGLGAAPTSLQFSEVYSALQTKVVDAQENPLAIVQTAKLYEVQKYCSQTNHSWDGYHFLFNARSWNGLPDDLKTILSTAFNEAGLQQRDDVRKLNEGLQGELTSKGLAFNPAAPDSFRAQLQKAGYYSEWKGKFGAESWAQLESAAGQVL
ncbi:TRAP transporter substrate-binding protein [Bosea caraganae]|uniref:TRAP transporter substrate-binding protein n=1 Tax=Bosea caraganae TaxID=2763117 RepID=A0A370KYA9_9HYPH|nr:TRAP transporter substrate-binding protein [Bosea caraganae]RDJ19957.1 TRAP transporter substrate-binding protein [Bosea caraganae]RDJ23896.1 TRAP transporter substrate-binding protein [Bosea caraganae]